MTGDVTRGETRHITFAVKLVMIQIGAKSEQVRDGPAKLHDIEMSLFAAFAEVLRYNIQSQHYTNNDNTLRYLVRSIGGCSICRRKIMAHYFSSPNACFSEACGLLSATKVLILAGK